jgi:hypothetical protein
MHNDMQFFVFLLTNETISAFYEGDNLYAMIDLDLSMIFMNKSEFF